MSQGFYEILGVNQDATGEGIHTAFHDQLAGLVRRLRAARRQGADVTILESQERGLKEAMAVLTDPVRRQRYDAYRRANHEGMPDSAESMWNLAKDALVDPLAIASLEVLRKTTELNIGNPFSVAPQPRKWAQRPTAPPKPPPAQSQPAPPQPLVAPTNGVPAGPDPSTELTDQFEQVQARPQAEARPQAKVAPPRAAPAPVPTPAQTAESSAPAPAPAAPNSVVSIAETYGMDGQFLRAVRELRKRTLDELAAETRISMRYLHALESNDFDSLPAETFVRGYVKEITRALKIDEVDAVEGYLALYRQQRG
jgi:curved DNA-binding protein CbpA